MHNVGEYIDTNKTIKVVYVCAFVDKMNSKSISSVKSTFLIGILQMMSILLSLIWSVNNYIRLCEIKFLIAIKHTEKMLIGHF